MSASDREPGNNEDNELLSLDRHARYVTARILLFGCGSRLVCVSQDMPLSADPIIHVKFAFILIYAIL